MTDIAPLTESELKREEAHAFQDGGLSRKQIWTHEEVRRMLVTVRHLQAEKAEWSERRDLTYHDVFAALRQVSSAAAIAATIEWHRAVEFGRGLYDSDEQCASQTGRALGIIEEE